MPSIRGHLVPNRGRNTIHRYIDSCFIDIAELELRTDVSELNDSRTVKPDGSAARRWFGDFTSFLQSLFALLSFV